MAEAPAPAEGRSWLEAEVADRAQHRTAEDVRTTCSFARAERLLGREYHGRFLIELLQNAADAWRADPRARTSACRVAIVLTDEPALLVANQGAPMTPGVVIKSLGQIGASTKAEGEAIGHKGIGFKSVLELTVRPQIFSGLQSSSPVLCVDFDPDDAQAAIRRSSAQWATLLADVPNLDPEDPYAAIPVLRFPHWIGQLPAEVEALADQGYDTVVRLPFDERFSSRLKLDEPAWLATVHDGLGDVSDQILLLLGSFSEVVIDDRTAGSVVRIRPEPLSTTAHLSDGVSLETIAVHRNEVETSRWHIYRRAIQEAENLAGEVVVGIRFDDTGTSVLPAIDDQASAPFHLFFPTRIPSGLPFLLHGYFEVDAARTGFYRGSADRNTAILTELADLAVRAVEQEASAGTTDLVSLVDLVALSGPPEDPLASSFRSAVLNGLDDVVWIPAHAEEAGLSNSRPADVFVWGTRLTRLVAAVFPPGYVRRKVELALPHPGLTNAALELVASRGRSEPELAWDLTRRLCCPGDVPMWDSTEADGRFRALLDLLDALHVEDRTATESLLEALRQDPDSKLLPAARPGGDREMLPVPDPAEGLAGSRSRLVMARVRAAATDVLVPPAQLDLAFLPEGLLSEEDIARGRPLGVRPFTVDNVLDRLNGIGQSDVDKQSLLTFLWRLLSRERVSAFGTKRCAERAASFEPADWFWCVPGRVREDETMRLRQQRERYLAEVPLPARDGQWRPAGTLAFGADWADWLESGATGPNATSAVRNRVEAYRCLEQIAPGESALLASPQQLAGLLPNETLEPVPEPLDEVEDPLDDQQHNLERLAFLLRLGVWEVPPIEAYENRERTGRDNFPWKGRIAELQAAAVEAVGGWRFGLDGWSGKAHQNVYLGEDYRFGWNLAACAARDAPALASALQRGVQLYIARSSAHVFCMSCRDPAGGSHQAARYSQTSSPFPSWLALQLRHDPWVACTLDGSPMVRPQAPASCWWHVRPPTGAGLRQSPWRLVPLCATTTGVGEELRNLAEVNTLDDSSSEVVLDLLASLQGQFEAATLAVDPYESGSARQAFIGLHRLAYRRLGELSGGVPAASSSAPALGNILCELGDQLTFRSLSEARHDDGKYSSYVRYFVGSVPLAVLPRDPDGAAIAARLGVEPFRVVLARRGGDDGIDVTADVRDMLGDRVPELLAMLVHHGLGTQTLELSSTQFDERAQRLKAMTVRQVTNLVIDARVDGSELVAVIGEGTEQDLFLDGPTSPSPILFHDLSGDAWRERLRRKIAPLLAAVVENPAYGHTFALFLQAESDAEREEFLLDLGISQDEVDVIASRVGAIGEAQSRQYLAWFEAVIRAAGAEPDGLDLDEVHVAAQLVGAGFDEDTARRVAAAGGTEAARRDTGPDSPLRLLSDAGVEPWRVHEELLRLGDEGLNLPVSRRAFARWMEAQDRRLTAVVVASGREVSAAKSVVRDLKPLDSERFSLDPDLALLLAPVVELLESLDLAPDLRGLCAEPAAELARLGRFDDPAALDGAALLLFDDEEQARLLRERAQRWRQEVRLLAVLARTAATDTRARIRTIDDYVHGVLPANPARPSDLHSAVGQLFIEQAALAEVLIDLLSDSVIAPPPDRASLLSLAKAGGVAIDRLALIERALDAPRMDRARHILRRVGRLMETSTAPRRPGGLQPMGPRPPAGSRRRINKMKVDESHDRRKRELGGEGEEWALAAVVGELLRLDRHQRAQAIDEIVALLQTFEGGPVEGALAHATAARSPDLEDDELVDELTGLLHLSQHSDAFGFDLLGWLSPGDGLPAQAMCLEVKSSGSEGFLLSRGEWARAMSFHEADDGDRYAVLVVRRARRGGVPSGMDLLADPVALVDAGMLLQEVDGYRLAYRAVTAG